MNKLIYIVFVFICICSCDERIDNAITEFKDNSSGFGGMVTEVYKFTYDSCDYISFEGNSSDRGFSVVHSPKCSNPIHNNK